MNRITAILLAMAALLVHILAVHRNGLGTFGAPYDTAHVAFHLGRNLVHHGEIWWSMDPATGATAGDLGSYPSPLLIWLAAAFEAFAAVFKQGVFTLTRCVQMVGIACALCTVFLSTRFDTDRNAGVIPALLLVFSGAIAASGASGTEWPIVTFLLAMAFVTLEHGRPRFSSVSLLALVVASPVGVVCVLVLALQTLLRTLAQHRRAAQDRQGGVTGRSALGIESKPPSLLVFLPAGVALALVHRSGASLLPDLAWALQFDPDTLQHGAQRLRDFVVVTASPVLLIFPLVALLLGELSGVGRRALILALVAAATTVALGGGAPESFGIAFTPALAMSFIAIQQGMARALDTYRRSMERGVWLSIAVVIFVALFASRFPGDLGQIKVERVQERVYRAHAEPTYGGSELMGRSALFNEVRLVEQLREIGSFMRARLPEGSSIMTPWPGALAYLSRHQVLDLFGRTTPVPGQPRTPWSPNPPKVDIEAALGQEPDYIVPSSLSIEEIPDGQIVDMLSPRLLESKTRDYEDVRSSVQARLANYEIVITPGSIPGRWRGLQWGDTTTPLDPLVLLRKRGIQEAPKLSTFDAGDFLEVRLGFDAPDADADAVVQEAAETAEGARSVRALLQVFDADVSLRLQDGSLLLLDPAGNRMAAAPGTARTMTGFIVDPQWKAAVTIARIPKAMFAEAIDGSAARALEARVYHHTMGYASAGTQQPSDAATVVSTSAIAAAPLNWLLR